MAVHEISDLMPSRIYLTVPPGFRKKPPSGVILHRDKLSPHEIEQRQGFRVTTPLRTLIDAARVAVDPEQLARGILDSIRKGLLSDRQLQTAIEMLHGPGRERLYRALEDVRRAA
jgi:hypothetical protein